MIKYSKLKTNYNCLKFYIIIFNLLIIFPQCYNFVYEANFTETKLEFEIKKNESDKKIINEIPIDTFYNDYCSVINGKEPMVYFKDIFFDQRYDSFLIKNKPILDSFSQIQLFPIRDWSLKNNIINLSNNTIFYPFGGPDYLYVKTLFDAHYNTIILVGLEDIGTIDTHSIPNFETFKKTASHINKVISSALNYGFFITPNMEKEFQNKYLNGSLHLILYFLNYFYCKVVKVEYGIINEFIEFIPTDIKQSSCVHINFIDNYDCYKDLYYFKVNLHDEYFEKNANFYSFVTEKAQFTTYLKATSYLVHKSYFSKLRNFILTNSNNILQDDSGIPLKYLDTNIWNINYWGTYNRTIPLFYNFLQPELITILQDSTPLNFKLGYNGSLNKTNIILARKSK